LLDLVLLQTVKSDALSFNDQILVKISPEKPPFSFFHHFEAVEVDEAEMLVVFEAD